MSNDLVMTIAGGVLVGLAAALLLATNGRILGVSGALGGLLTPKRGDIGWRVALIAGLALGGVTLRIALPAAFDVTPARPLVWTLVAGLLVGFGTRLGNGCTSGHGICGCARLNPRSIVATIVFVGVGMLTASILHVFVVGGAS